MGRFLKIVQMLSGKRRFAGVSAKTARVPLALPVPDWTLSGTRTGKASGHIDCVRIAKPQRFVGVLHFQTIAQADGMGFAVDFDIDVVVADAIYLCP